MKRRFPRFGLLTLLALPTMFALGWWTRNRNYERDVDAAAEKLAVDSGGIYIPELGIIRGHKRFFDRLAAMSPEAKVEMVRRLTFNGAERPQTSDMPFGNDVTNAQRRIEFFRQMSNDLQQPGHGSNAHQEDEDTAEP